MLLVQVEVHLVAAVLGTVLVAAAAAMVGLGLQARFAMDMVAHPQQRQLLWRQHACALLIAWAAHLFSAMRWLHLCSFRLRSRESKVHCCRRPGAIGLSIWSQVSVPILEPVYCASIMHLTARQRVAMQTHVCALARMLAAAEAVAMDLHWTQLKLEAEAALRFSVLEVLVAGPSIS